MYNTSTKLERKSQANYPYINLSKLPEIFLVKTPVFTLAKKIGKVKIFHKILKSSKHASLWSCGITKPWYADFIKFPKNVNLHSDGNILTHISSRYMNIGNNKLSI